ncbi:nuclear pore complex subunit Nup133 [Cordyceps fumosorosea ARSEF 2679]|uniref:Nuclear pore complex subunit Nup133 n=1 Tax=Cordyceps fumosorosea (strain ARSEF 2679) TaxID=1081104 RepID=A0A167NER9_CORFA|nr:nuclear pore complex subunit Nup133 [Cordyceps fumosorosea ARSEF 2679]OAA55478.1 nuclear pore complex subunit Nup133 [Cordyceps fumosorosea ARSEF 2679]
MFSTAVTEGGPATATRSRRRQRPKSQESLVPQPKAKRQRVPLSEQTFVNPDAQANTVVEAPVVVEKRAPAAEPVDDAGNENVNPAPRKELNLRTKKTKHADRAASKGDGSVALTKTDAYIVSKLPAIPDRIRSDWSLKQHADISSSFGYALTLSQTNALVWPYHSTSQSPETFTFTLPTPGRPSDPLPVGCFVSPSASSTEPGLVVVTASSGKVVFWESISSAATFAFIKKDRSGVEHSISGMSHGEKVTSITNAESAGFIITFNSGRLAYMSVRDNHGRPAISVQFLRSNLATAGGGIFGSIRHAFSNLSLRGEIAAVRADRSARVGERNIVALTSKGKLQAWKIHRGGHNEHIGEAEMRDSLYSALYEADPYTKDFSPDSLEALDFTFVPKGLEHKYLEMSRLSDAMATDDASVQHLLLLVSLTRKSVARYSLVEVILRPNSCKVGMVRPITSYSTPLQRASGEGEASSSPRVYLPRPALVAFVVFERAAVMASVALPPESPDSQLQSDNHILPPSFEDVVDFREDDLYEIVGSGFEEMPSVIQEDKENRIFRQRPTRNPAALLMVRGAGVIRFITTDIDKFASEQAPQVSAKSKLEQTVFSGSRKGSPLIFDGRRETSFTGKELSTAALEVSQEILGSTTTHMPTLPASLEDNLRERSRALERLVRHLQSIGADMDRSTRWNLLYNAEKMHVATLIWKLHEAFTAARPADDKKSLIGSIVEFIHEDQKSNPVAAAGEVDAIRHWFINDVFRLELFVAWGYEVIKTLYKDRLLDDTKITVMMNEAIQLNVTTHFGALEFRKENLDLYGLGEERMSLGILRDNIEGMPEPWTGCHYLANNVKRLLDLSDQWYKKHQSLAAEKMQGTDKPNAAILAKIFDELPSLTDAALTAVLEYARWGATSPDHNTFAQSFAKVYAADRFEKPVFLARAGKWEEGALLAEKHQSLHGLAVVLLDHVEALEQQLAQPGLPASEAKVLKALREAKKSQLEDRFSRYGKDFAFPVYEFLLEKHGVEAVLEFDLETLGFKTLFLRSKPELARISWINDIEQEKDVDHAADTLVSLALNKEQQAWNKRVELSLGKLALLAEAEEKQEQPNGLKVAVNEARHESQLATVENELITLKVQDELYKLILTSTYDAVDEAAALNFAMEAHSANIPRRQKVLLQLFEDGMERLLKHEALDAMTLIDLLTLVYFKPEQQEHLAHPFWMALKVAESSCHAEELKEAKRLIWRRLFIRDDWARINDTQLKHDREVVAELADTELYAVLADCVRYQDEREPFRPMSPQEALGAFTEDLDRRFRDLGAEIHTKQIEAMRWEDKALKQNIDKHRLADWLRTCLGQAQAEVQRQAEEASMAAREDPIVVEDAMMDEVTNGHVPGQFIN